MLDFLAEKKRQDFRETLLVEIRLGWRGGGGEAPLCLVSGGQVEVAAAAHVAHLVSRIAHNSWQGLRIAVRTPDHNYCRCFFFVGRADNRVNAGGGANSLLACLRQLTNVHASRDGGRGGHIKRDRTETIVAALRPH